MRIFNLILSASALLIGGCAAHLDHSQGGSGYNRLALAAPPVQARMLDRNAREPITVLARMSERYGLEPVPAEIEPAAGEQAEVINLLALPVNRNCSFSKTKEPVGVSLGFDGSSVRASDITGPVVRFTFSLQPESKPFCRH